LSVQATPSIAGDTLTYEWSTTGGTIQGSGPSVQVSTAGLTAGSYVATVRVTEERPNARPGTPSLFADCSARFSVVNPPTVELSADHTQVQVGEAVNFTARGNSPDNRPLTYQWSTTGGSLQGSGTTARLDTARVQPGSVTATVRVVDDRNLSAQDSETISVVAPPPPPPPQQTQLLDQCQFAQNSARVDNVCKARLDSIALRLRSEPDATLSIVGLAASNEGNPQQLSQARANNVRSYLATEKGIAQGRLSTRTGAAGTGPETRRAEMHLVPRGATALGNN
jgi:outer membrane protein OmpA-like peptidoglycan-associated protein